MFKPSVLMTTTEFDYSKYRLSFHMFIFVLLYWHFKGSNTVFKQCLLKRNLNAYWNIYCHFNLFLKKIFLRLCLCFGIGILRAVTLCDWRSLPKQFGGHHTWWLSFSTIFPLFSFSFNLWLMLYFVYVYFVIFFVSFPISVLTFWGWCSEQAGLWWAALELLSPGTLLPW